MKRKDYRKPTMQIVKLQHKCQILSGSGFGASRPNYGTANDGVDSKELNTEGEWEWK